MSRPRFLANHDVIGHIIHGLLLREPTIDFSRAYDIGLARRPDDELLAYAAQHGYVLFSHDVNTMSAAAYQRLINNQPMAGLILAHQDDSVRMMIDQLLLIWSATELEEWDGQVRFLPL